MKMDSKVFAKKVRDMRRMLPYRSNGRRVVLLSEETKKGQEIIALGSRWEGNDLCQVYDKWSADKQKAFDDAWEMYRNARHGDSFGICSHNSFGFTVSWLSDDGLTVLTKDTEYLVVFNE